MRITIVGAGNMGLAMAAYAAAGNKGDICLFTRKDILKRGALRMHDVEAGEDCATDGFTVTADPLLAFGQADVILVTYPAFLRRAFILQYQSYIRTGAFLGFVPGYGGVEYACGDLLQKGVTVFGFQRVPYVARCSQDDQGYTAGILSRKSRLFISAIPHGKTDTACRLIHELLDIPVQPLREYLSITLAPSNPLLHIAGLYGVFRDYQPGQAFDHPLRFYEEWNDDTSRLLFRYDEELQNICRGLAPLDLTEVVPLPVYYESPTPEAMTRKLKSIPSFEAVMVPLKQAENGYVPDLDSRMFVEDYPYGVCVIKDFARITGVETPVVDLLLKFYTRLSGHRYFQEDGAYTDEIMQTGVPGIHGFTTAESIVRFYHQS